jgi:hypothetical protein
MLLSDSHWAGSLLARASSMTRRISTVVDARARSIPALVLARCSAEPSTMVPVCPLTCNVLV